jgi:hypothetical protein
MLSLMLFFPQISSDLVGMAGFEPNHPDFDLGENSSLDPLNRSNPNVYGHFSNTNKYQVAATISTKNQRFTPGLLSPAVVTLPLRRGV